ncbi:MAG: 3-oxoacyl-ACP synthase [Spirochaetia bacterium]|jgi:3-oxoacyl-[acyl-carrier-protein] synthase-3|nr:3-oxoacyl-ACP synthase [Spirochaetia bacterium]
MHVGLTGIGVYVPETYMSAADLAQATAVPEDVIAQKYGILQKPVAGEDDTTAVMGIKAARQAMAEAGINGGDIDLVLWCGAQHKDYTCWLAGLYVANELGAKNAWSFDMEAMCGSMMAALDVAKSLMLTRPDLGTVLLVSGYRNNDLIDLAEPTTRFMMDIGSGGAACVLQKNAGKNVLLGSAFKGDGSLSLDCIIPTLGTKAWPPKEGDLQKAHFMVADEPTFKAKLGAKTLPNFYWVIDRALELSDGLSRKDIDYLAVLHFKKSAHDAILVELGINDEQTTYLNEYGHIGQNDQLLSIKLALAAGKIQNGQNLVLVGAGLGFVWAASVVRWGPYVE